jgi:hypothetical protein
MNNKKLVVVFGRFQVPTKGHKELINFVSDYARRTGAEARIYTSHSHDKDKNPLPYELKLLYLRQLFPGVNIVQSPHKNLWDILKEVSAQGYEHVTVVTGSDRVQEFKRNLIPYCKPRTDPTFDPKKNYGFKISVISSGARKSGISGTDTRKMIKRGDFEGFMKISATDNRSLAKRIFDTSRNYLSEETIDEGAKRMASQDSYLDHFAAGSLRQHSSIRGVKGGKPKVQPKKVKPFKHLLQKKGVASFFPSIKAKPPQIDSSSTAWRKRRARDAAEFLKGNLKDKRPSRSRRMATSDSWFNHQMNASDNTTDHPSVKGVEGHPSVNVFAKPAWELSPVEKPMQGSRHIGFRPKAPWEVSRSEAQKKPFKKASTHHSTRVIVPKMSEKIRLAQIGPFQMPMVMQPPKSPILKNPSSNDFDSMANRCYALRILRDRGDWYFWDGEAFIHAEVIKHLGLAADHMQHINNVSSGVTNGMLGIQLMKIREQDGSWSLEPTHDILSSKAIDSVCQELKRDKKFAGITKNWNIYDVHKAEKSKGRLTFSQLQARVKRDMDLNLAEEKKYAIATRAKTKTGWRRVPDTRFDTEESARRYGDKYHTDRSGARMYKVVEHPDSKKRLHENLDRKTFHQMLQKFVEFTCDELGIDKVPELEYKDPNEHGEQPSFGGYAPGAKKIIVMSKNRHPMDIFRTVAHELVHHKQNEDGKLHDKSGETGSPEEDEANYMAGRILRKYGKSFPQAFEQSYVTEETIEEGVNDKGIFKAIFLAGGAGSGKDYILKTCLDGNGLKELNSDQAFEYILRKEGGSLHMPPEEHQKRMILRGRAKNITQHKKEGQLGGRLGVIVNGTADEFSKIFHLKHEYETLGYETMMVFVGTSNKTSRERNIARGKSGGREVPEDIRYDKWRGSHKNKDRFKELFGANHFIFVDNSIDVRTAPPGVKARIEALHTAVWKKVSAWVNTPVKNTKAQEWITAQRRSRGISEMDDRFSEMLAESKRIGIRKKMKQPNIVGDKINDTLGKQTDYMNMNMPASDPIGVWSVKEETKRRFKERYGQLGEAKLRDTVAKIQRTYKESLTDPFTGSSASVSATTGNDDLSSSPLGNVDMAKEKEKLSIYGKKKRNNRKAK